MADGLPSKRKKAELKPIDEEVPDPDRLLMERLRELYYGSSWASLREFSEAIGRVRARKYSSTLENMPHLKPDTGTLSYYMRGGGRSGARDRPRRVTEEFLHEFFEALEEDWANGQAGGSRLTEDVRADTLRLYVEAIRVTQPVRARLLELQAQHEALGDRYEGLRQLVDDLRDELERARVERDALDEQNKLLRERSDLDAAALRANEDRRAVFTAKIEELKDDLAHAQQERDRVRRDYEELKGEMRAAVEAAAVERQILVEQHEAAVANQVVLLEETLRDVEDERAKRLSAEAQLQSVYQELTAPMPAMKPEPVPAPTAPTAPQIDDVAATIAKLHELRPGADESLIISRLRMLLKKFPQMEDMAIESLCTYVRSVRGLERVRDRWVSEGRSALDLIVELLGHPNAARTSTDLSGTDLSYRTFQGRDLRYVRLSRCSLERVNFRGTDLTNADLQGAVLLMANFTGATLHGTKLVGATGLTLEALTDAKIDKNTIPPDNLILVRRSWGRWALAEPERNTAPEQPTAPQPAASVGQLLREARTRQGYSLAGVSARMGTAEGLLEMIESDDPRGLRFREVVTAFAADIGADPLKVAAFLKRQAKSPIDEFLDEPKPWHRT